MNIVTKGLGSTLLITQGYGTATVISPVIVSQETSGGAMSSALWKKRKRPYKREVRTRIIKRYPVYGSIITRIYKNFDLFGAGASFIAKTLEGFGSARLVVGTEIHGKGNVSEPVKTDLILHSKLKTFNNAYLKLDGKKLAKLDLNHIEVSGSKLLHETCEAVGKVILKDKIALEKPITSKVDDRKLRLALFDI